MDDRRRSLFVMVPALLAGAGCLGGDSLNAEGRINITVDGTQVDLSKNRFSSEHAENSSIDFHVHKGHKKWYMEGEERLTVTAAIDKLPHFSYDDRTLTFDGESYDGGSPGTEITVLVNDEEVEPTAYKLEDGDTINITVTRNNTTTSPDS